MPDLSYYPESYLVKEAMGNAVGFGKEHLEEIRAMADAADLALGSFKEARAALEAALGATSPWVRYWGAMSCTAFGEEAVELAPKVESLLKDGEPAVQLRAVEFLGEIGKIQPQPALVELVNGTDDGVFATEVLNSVVWFRDHFGGAFPIERSAFTTSLNEDGVKRRLAYLAGDPYGEEAKTKAGKGRLKKKTR